MQKITNIQDLKDAIKHLEYKQASKWPLLQEEFFSTYESLKPINIIKNTIKDAFSIPDFIVKELKTNFVNTTIGIVTGAVAKKVLVRDSQNPLMKLFGGFLEMPIANKVAKNGDEIKVVVNTIINTILNKSDSEKIDEY